MPRSQDESPRLPEPSAASRIATLRKPALGLAAVAALFVLARSAGDPLLEAVAWVEGLGPLGPVVFIVLYVFATVFFIPGSILTLAGGALFGLAGGLVYVFIAAFTGSSLAFLIARYGARAWVEERLGSNPQFEALDRAVAEEGLKITFLLRLSPVFPFNFLNYGLGLTRVSLRDYMIASLGMLPATFLYVYSGRVIGDVALLAGGASPERGAGYYALLALGLAATVAVTAVVTRTARRALANTNPAPESQKEDQ
ncbi:MAG: TVP38/TMEM64 family protein [Myxococcota bacterium]|nr:TVP38/TMEM64 family protein [Myxococcota bacterium]